MKLLLIEITSCPNSLTDRTWNWLEAANQFMDENHWVRAVRAPATWDGCFASVEKIVGEGWDAVVCIASRKQESLSVEKVAINESDVTLKDSSGRRPRNKMIESKGDPGYWTGLPYRDLCIDFTNAGLPANPSHSAGHGFPNYLFYKLMLWIDLNMPSLLGGLIHVPEDWGREECRSKTLNCFINTILNTLSGATSEKDSLRIDLGRIGLSKEFPRP